MPGWVPPVGESAGFGLVSVARAVAAGLAFRTLPDTIKATLDWYDSLEEGARGTRLAGISPGDALDGPEDAVRSAPRTKNGRRLTNRRKRAV